MTRKFVAAAFACAARLRRARRGRRGLRPDRRGHCLLPFPNDFFTERDAAHADRAPARARRARRCPRNKDGVRIDPREWNRADGFSPGQQITVRIPGLDTQARRSTATGSRRSPTSAEPRASASRSC